MQLATTALVVVDMQRGFVNDRSRHVVPVVTNLVRRWQAAGGDTVFTRYFNYEHSQYERLIHWSRMRESPETDLVEELLPCLTAERSFVVDKTIYSLFTDEGAALVRQHGWTDLLVCGIATDGCVLKTAVDAFEAGYTPWVLRDACASHAGFALHEAGLLLTGRFIGRDQVLDSSVLLGQLLPLTA